MIRWGFLGAGTIAANALGPAVQAAEGAVLQAAGARSRERAAALGPVTAYGSYEEVLADPALGLVNDCDPLVMGQEPSPGTMLAPGGAVGLVVSAPDRLDPAMAGWQPARTLRVAHGFYTSQALEMVRP